MQGQTWPTLVGDISLQKVQLPAATVSLIRKCFLTYSGMDVAGQLFRVAVKQLFILKKWHIYLPFWVRHIEIPWEMSWDPLHTYVLLL